MKVIVKKNITLEQLYENKDKSWEDTMRFLEIIKYGDYQNDEFVGKKSEDANVFDIGFKGKIYCVNGSVLEIIEEQEEDKPIEIQKLKTYSGENYSDDKGLIVNKINELVDKVNELERGNE